MIFLSKKSLIRATSYMNPESKEWIGKAEGDWVTMNREYVVTSKPNYDAVCFHAQQCAEKYLKGYMFHRNIPFAKIHDLPKLLKDLIIRESEFSKLKDSAIVLTSMAIEIRYPGMQAIKTDAKRAIKNCTLFRTQFRSAFELPDEN